MTQPATAGQLPRRDTRRLHEDQLGSEPPAKELGVRLKMIAQDRTIQEGNRLRFYLEGGDPDGDPVVFLSKLLPPGSFLDPNTGLFDWTPGPLCLAAHAQGEAKQDRHLSLGGDTSLVPSAGGDAKRGTRSAPRSSSGNSARASAAWA